MPPKPHPSNNNTKKPSSPLSNAKGKALESLPSWCDKKAIGTVMDRRKKRTAAEINRDNCHHKLVKDLADEKFKVAYKLATTELNNNQKGKNRENVGTA